MRHPLRERPTAERATVGRPVSRRLPLALRTMGDDSAPRGEQARDRPLALVEAALLLADEPLTARRLATLAGLRDATTARRLVERLHQLYETDGSAFQVEELAGGYQLLSREEFHPWLSRLRRNAAEFTLSAAARETLTIIAYNQPITRADIEVIRAAGCADILSQLMERGLVRMAGRDDSLGRPALYETTKQFLQRFGLRSLRELPAVEGIGRQEATKGEDEKEG